MRVLVTGGAGFIGSALVDQLIDRGDEVTVLDSFDPATHPARPTYLNPNARYVEGDVRDPEAWRSLLPEVDAISHQAAMVGLGVDLDDIVDYVSSNDLGTAVGLRAMNGLGWEGRLVLASSMVVYGEGRYRCDEHGLVTAPPRAVEDLQVGRFEPRCPECAAELTPESVPETAAADPRNVYAATKLHQEHLANAWSRETGSSAISLRYHNVYGPRMPRDTPYAGVAAIFRSSVARGEEPRVFEDGRQRRDFVHVADIAAANLAALDAPHDVGGAFNIASGTPRTVGQMAAALAEPAGLRPEIVGGYRLGDVRHVFASIERAVAELGYEPLVAFEDGMVEFADAPLRGD